jgi:predicted double-glycine peptidase
MKSIFESLKYSVLVSVLCLSLLVFGESRGAAAELSPVPNLVTPSPQLPSQFLKLPLVRQAYDYSCGAGALMSVLAYWGEFDDAETSLYRQINTTPSNGTEPEPMARYARKLGLDAEVLRNQTIGDLRSALARGETWILDIQAWPLFTQNRFNVDQIKVGQGQPVRPDWDWSQDWVDGHYVVLVGMDEHYAYFMDPSTVGSYTFMTLADLELRWHDTEYQNGYNKKVYHLAIRIKGKTPATTLPMPLVRMD